MAADNSTAASETPRAIVGELGVLFEALHDHGSRLTQSGEPGDTDIAMLPKLIAARGGVLLEKLESILHDFGVADKAVPEVTHG